MSDEPQMTSGLDRLTDALRRYWIVLVAFAVVGLVAGIAISAASTAEYRATAQLLLNDQGASTILPGSDAQAGDAQRDSSTAVTLADSGAFYDEVTRRYHGLAVGAEDAPDLPGDFSVDADTGTSLLTVSGTGSSAAVAEKVANTVAAAFPDFRAQTLQRPLRQNELALEAQLRSSPDDAQVKDSLSRVRVLERLAGRSATVVDVAQSADKVRPTPARDAVVGLVSGLVLGLLFMALREGLSSRVRDDDAVEHALGARVVATLSRRALTKGGAPLPGIERLVVLLHGWRNPARDTVVCIVGAEPRMPGAALADAVRAELTRRGESALQLAPDPDSGIGMGGVLALPGGGVIQPEEQVVAVAQSRGWAVVQGPDRIGDALMLELTRVADVVVLAVPAGVSRRELSALAHEVEGWPRRPSMVVLSVT